MDNIDNVGDDDDSDNDNDDDISVFLSVTEGFSLCG